MCYNILAKLRAHRAAKKSWRIVIIISNQALNREAQGIKPSVWMKEDIGITAFVCARIPIASTSPGFRLRAPRRLTYGKAPLIVPKAMAASNLGYTVHESTCNR
jgi:hypothetical protein